MKSVASRFLGVLGLAAAVLMPGAAMAEPLTIYEASHASTGDPFWAPYFKGMNDAAEQYGVTLVSLATGSYESSARNIEKLDQAIAAHPAGIIVTVQDYRASDASLRRAKELGLPVIAVNAAEDPRPETERIPYLFYIGGNEEMGGRQAAQRVLRDKTPARTVCVIHQAGHAGLAARCKGWTDVMAEKGISTDILNVPTDRPTEQAEQIKAYLTSHPETDAMFVVGPPPTSVAIQVLDEIGKTGAISLFGFDMTSEMLEAIDSGALVGTVDQQPYLQGYLGVEFLVLHAQHGFTIGGPVLTGPAIVDKSNVAVVKQGVADGYR